MDSPQHPADARPPRRLTSRLAAAPLTLSVMALVAAQLACGAGRPAGNNSPADTSAPAADGAVSVDAKLLGFKLSADNAAAGPVSFTVTNDDFLPHDFRLTGNGVEAQTERLQPGDETTLTLALEPGTYTYICTVEGHSENMRGTFTVR